MTKLPMHAKSRNHERGAVAIMIAFMWTALFGMAVIAVDFGYLYTKRRGLQAAADSAVVASMPTYKTNGFSAAQTRAIAVATANGYTDGLAATTVQVTQPVANDFQVRIQRTYPTFFGGLLGFGSKQMTGLSKGRVIPGASGAAIHADSPACGGPGFTIQGNGFLNVTGDIESNGWLQIGWMGAGCYPAPSATCKITGTVKGSTACPGNPQNPSNFTITGGTSTAASYPNPLLLVTPANFAALCTKGTILNAADPVAFGDWKCGAGPGGTDLLANNVYCSAGNVNVASPCIGQTIYAVGSTFISNGGTITFGANNGITLGNAPGVPSNMIAMATGVGAGCGVPAINIGFANAYIMNGTVYAPNGCINGGGGGTSVNTFNGQLVGSLINLSLNAGATWNFTGTGGGPGPSWSLVQ